MDIKLFLSGEGVDAFGRTFSEILNRDNFWWDECHSHMCMVFPLPEPSGFSEEAPILTPEDITLIKASPIAMENILKAFTRYKNFLGLKDDYSVYDKSSAKYYELPNHNWLRFSRVIRCLRIFGYNLEAVGFYEFLKKNVKNAGFSEKYWESAALDELDRYIGLVPNGSGLEKE